jgi:hypothetical protein
MIRVASIKQTALGGIRRSLDGLRGTAHEIATVSVSGPSRLRSEILSYAPWSESGRSRPLPRADPRRPALAHVSRIILPLRAFGP